MSTTKVQLNIGSTSVQPNAIFKGPAADASMFTEMKRRRLQAIGTWNGQKPPGDYRMQRGFTEGLTTARNHLQGAFKNYISS